MTKLLLVIDMQNDFMPGGPLTVPGSDQLIPYLNRTQPTFDLVIASKDWHPKGHVSFASSNLGGKWPDHCIQKSWGAEFPDFLDTRSYARVFYKGTEQAADGFSAFYLYPEGPSTGLFEFLQEKKIKTITVVGVATDYCVKETVLDALRLGFNPIVLKEGCRGFERSELALQDMERAGSKVT